VWSELRERVAQYDSRTSDMRLRGGGVSPSVEARNFTDRGGLLPCPTWGHFLATSNDPYDNQGFAVTRRGQPSTRNVFWTSSSISRSLSAH
jgi:hypothetical protein